MTTTSPDDILTIKQLSEYLMVSEKTIYRMLEKAILPALRVGGQWRFRRRDIDAWIDNQIKKVEIDGDRRVLSELEQSEIEIAPLMEKENVWLGTSRMSRNELLTWMLLQAKLDEGTDRNAVTQSVLLREEICSTALLQRVAFPHPNDPSKFRFPRKRVLMAILSEPMNYLDPHDHKPQIVVMILARTVQGYLLTLSRAIKLFGNNKFVDQLLGCKRSEDVIDRIRKAEQLIRPGKS
jgi:nitrogen PTS system EIIA component